jgi:hypothetical protein
MEPVWSPLFEMIDVPALPCEEILEAMPADAVVPWPMASGWVYGCHY